MWKTILAFIGVILATVAVWLLVEMRPNNRTIEFINCKVENTQLTIQYGRCLDTLNALRALQPPQVPSEPGTDPDPDGMVTDADPGGMVTDADPGGMVTDADPGGMVTDADPGGMITDPDPGGMVTDPHSGKLPWFSPTIEDLEQCGFRNRSFRDSVVKCASRLELCAAEAKCWDDAG